MRRIPTLVPVLAGLALAACSSLGGRARSSTDRIEDLIARGRFEEAVRQAAALRERDPGDEEYEFLHRKATLGYLMAAGREATLENEDERALELFRRASEVAPESDQALEWFHKTRGKLAQRWQVTAEELHAEGNLDEALAAYQQALEYDSAMLPAREGASQILLLQNYHAGLSERYYNEGVRALHDYFLRISRGRFQYTQKYRPEDERAIARESEVEERMAEERFTVARTLEENGHYAAARNEYYIVLLMRPEDESARERYDRMKAESEAKRVLDEVSMAMLRRDFDHAEALLRENREKAVLQRAQFDDMLANLDDSRIRAMYEEALVLERDFRFEEAVELYEMILEQRQWFEDVRTRLETVQTNITRAAELYETARTATTDEARLQALRELEFYWPDYRDVRDQIIALKAKLGVDDESILDAPESDPRAEPGDAADTPAETPTDTDDATSGDDAGEAGGDASGDAGDSGTTSDGGDGGR